MLATAPQVEFLRDLYRERVGAANDPTIQRFIAGLPVEKFQAIQCAKRLKLLPRKPRVFAMPAPAPVAKNVPTRPGVFRIADGTVFVVKLNKTKTGLYAMKVVPSPSPRRAENGDLIDIELAFAGRGTLSKIDESDRMAAVDASAITRRYGRCICCNRKLKVASSVDAGIGPICIKWFR